MKETIINLTNSIVNSGLSKFDVEEKLNIIAKSIDSLMDYIGSEWRTQISKSINNELSVSDYIDKSEFNRRDMNFLNENGKYYEKAISSCMELNTLCEEQNIKEFCSPEVFSDNVKFMDFLKKEMDNNLEKSNLVNYKENTLNNTLNNIHNMPLKRNATVSQPIEVQR